MNIKENILRMKDMTELMLDLAYSAVFLKDRQIVDKVKDMHKEIGLLEEQTLKMVFKIKESDEDRMFIVNLTDYIKDISNAALQIAELSSGKGTPPIVRDILTESSKMVITAKIHPKSSYANKMIGQNHIRTNTKATIIGVKRSGSWIFSIDKNFRLMPDDEVIAIGSYEADKLFKKYASD
ncbi:hypothetical protein COV19_02465 [Candidatus Woesearchaeota archaeon CG10_big_fil_rev_8_21_14_0_10_44_13]|nr:MAG: hypothetical protein COV19_02465 [Candidatus Woesearchaeota archaeon CG10_big_fil_rev_8_21_14_0_10_44_13]